MKMLIIDDDSDWRELLQELIKEDFPQLDIICPSIPYNFPGDIIGLCGREKFDIAIIDLWLGTEGITNDIHGIDLAKSIKRVASQTKIIIISSDVDSIKEKFLKEFQNEIGIADAISSKGTGMLKKAIKKILEVIQNE